MKSYMEITTGLLRLLRKQINFVLANPNSSFYREKYAKDNWDGKLRAAPDFLKIPPLLREEIVQTPAHKRCFVKEAQVKAWSVSSGTTDAGPLVIPKIVHKRDTVHDITAQIMQERGVTKVMALASPTYFGNTRARIWCYHEKLRRYPFISGLPQNLAASAKLAGSLGIDGLETTSSILGYFIPFLKEAYDPSLIKFIILFGEFTSEQRHNFFRSLFKNAFFHYRFGGSEYPISPGFRCKNLASLPPRFFHPKEDFYLFEVISGELILTTLEKCAFPLIRYRTGDAVVWRKRKCSCGRESVIEHLGRVGYDFLKVAGGMIHTEMIDKALQRAKIDSSAVYELHVYEVVDQRRLKIKLELHLSERVKQTAFSIIEKNLYLSRTQTLNDLVKQELFLPLSIKFASELGGKPKTVKIVSHLL